MFNLLQNAKNVMLLVELLAVYFKCPAVKIFWEKVIDWWNRKRSENINPNQTEVIYGYKPKSVSFHTFNHYLLIARYILSGSFIIYSLKRAISGLIFILLLVFYY